MEINLTICWVYRARKAEINYLQTLVGARDMLEVGSPLKMRAEWNGVKGEMERQWCRKLLLLCCANHLTNTPGGKRVFGSRFKGYSPSWWERYRSGHQTWLLTLSLQ